MLKNLLLLSLFSAFVVVVLIGLEIYHNFQSSSLTTRTQTRIIPIPPNFDKETLDKLKTRKSVQVNLSDKTRVISEESISTQSLPSQNDQVQSSSPSGSTL